MSGDSIPAPLKFRTRRENVNWRRINAIDVDRVACELDVEMLQEHIAVVTFCSLEYERCLNCQSPLDSALLKLFRLAQLTIEYLLHSQNCLALSLQAAEEQLKTEAKEKEDLQMQLQKQSQDAKFLKEELKQRKKIISSQQAMITAGLANYHKCQHCEKTFMNASFLRSHMERRHPMEHGIKLITDDRKDLQIAKLQEEITSLQDQVTLAKSAMDTWQKDYNTKQEISWTEKIEKIKEEYKTEKNQLLTALAEAQSTISKEKKRVERQVEEMECRLEEQQQIITSQSMQEISWTAKMEKIKEKYESEKNQLQTALAEAQSTISKEKKKVKRQVEEMECRLEEKQQIITSQSSQIKYLTTDSSKSTIQQEEFTAVAAAPEPKTRRTSEQSSLVYKLDPIMELSEEDKDSSCFSEDPDDNQSRQQQVNELLKNPSLKRDMHLAVQQSLHDKLLHLGIEPAVGGLSMMTYENVMALVVSERQQKQREYAEYCKMQNDLSQSLDKRVKERSTQPLTKPKQSGQVRTLPQSRIRSNSLPITVTQVVPGASGRQQTTLKPARQNTCPTTSIEIAPQKTPRFSLNEDSSSEQDSPQAQRATVKSHGSGVQQHTDSPALASLQNASQSSHQRSHQVPVFTSSKMEVTVPESDSEWTECSEIEEISIDQLQKHTDQNGIVPKTSCSYVKALRNNLDQQPADQGHKKTAGLAIPDKPAGVAKTNDAMWEIKQTDFKDNNNDDWDISSIEDIPAAQKSISAPGRRSIDKSLDTSTSVWGTFSGKGQEPGLKDTGSTLKSSIVTVSDWDDSDST